MDSGMEVQIIARLREHSTAVRKIRSSCADSRYGLSLL